MATSDSPEDALPLRSSRFPKLSIVIPAYNEANRIRESLSKIAAYLKSREMEFEILVVDDGSADNTAQLVEQMRLPHLRVIRNERNCGKGCSVRKGVLAAAGDYVLFSDADLSTPIEELDKLFSAALNQDADAVVGSRGLDDRYIEKHQPSVREGGGRLFNVVVRMILGMDIRDTQCGFKLFKTEKARPIFQKQTIKGFGFDPEILFVMSRNGMKILEVPVRWSHAEGSKVRFLRDGIGMVLDLLRIRWNNLIGKYS